MMGKNPFEESSFDVGILRTRPDFTFVTLDDDGIEAHQSKCAICHFDFSSTSATEQNRISHFQECWKNFRDDLSKKERIKPGRVAMENPVSVAKLPTEVVGKTGLVPNLSAADIPLTSCLLCTCDLSNHGDELDALNHRINCMDKTAPTLCPICSKHFYEDEGRLWTRQSIIWHLHNCHHGGSLSVIAQYDFEGSLAAWSAMSETVERTLAKHFGAKKNWNRQQHLAHYTETLNAGRERGGGIYSAGNSQLRKAICVDRESGIEIMTWQKTVVSACTGLDHFRRCLFSILETPEGKRLSRRFRVERVFRENIPPRPPPPSRFAPKVPRTASTAPNSEERGSIQQLMLPLLQIPKTINVPDSGQIPKSLISPEVCPALSTLEDEGSIKSQCITQRLKIIESHKPNEEKGFQAVSTPDKPEVPNQSQNPASNRPREIKAHPVSVALPRAADLFGLRFPKAKKAIEQPLQRNGSLGSPVRSPGEVQTMVAMPNSARLFTKQQLMRTGPKPIVYAHTKFLQNNRFIVFGEGIVPPRPDSL